jgi:AraC-like DNA-binding protein
MALHLHHPELPLSQYVEMFWLWEDFHVAHPRERILPGGAMELVIKLSGDPFVLSYPSQPERRHTFCSPIVAGIRSEYFLVDTPQPTTILGVWFKSCAAIALFGVAAFELLNLHVPLDVLWGQQEASDLYHRLLEAAAPGERFRIVEQALLNRLADAAAPHYAVPYALKTFITTPHRQTVSDVVQEIGLSQRRFIQVFSEEIGLTPKLFCRIQRFQQALRMIAHGESSNWVEIALNCGYYDQAHLIRDFQEFAGMSPTMYTPQSREHRLNLPE